MGSVYGKALLELELSRFALNLNNSTPRNSFTSLRLLASHHHMCGGGFRPTSSVGVKIEEGGFKFDTRELVQGCSKMEPTFRERALSLSGFLKFGLIIIMLFSSITFDF